MLKQPLWTQIQSRWRDLVGDICLYIGVSLFMPIVAGLLIVGAGACGAPPLNTLKTVGVLPKVGEADRILRFNPCRCLGDRQASMIYGIEIRDEQDDGLWERIALEEIDTLAVRSFFKQWRRDPRSTIKGKVELLNDRPHQVDGHRFRRGIISPLSELPTEEIKDHSLRDEKGDETPRDAGQSATGFNETESRSKTSDAPDPETSIK